MREPWRSAYLKSMGVDIYVARRPLAGAAPSIAPLWDTAAVVRRGTTPEPHVRVEPEAVAPAQPPSAKALRGLPEGLDLDGGAPPAVAAEPVARAATTAVPRFVLQVVRSAGVLLLDEGPARNSDRNAYRQFIMNLLVALGRRPADVEIDRFGWPMVTNPSVDQSEQAARESLSASIERRCDEGSCDIIVLLGPTAQQWVQTQRPALKGESAWACIGDGSAKRALWQQLATQLAR